MSFTVKGAYGIEINVYQVGALFCYRMPSGFGGSYSTLNEVMEYLQESGKI